MSASRHSNPYRASALRPAMAKLIKIFDMEYLVREFLENSLKDTALKKTDKSKYYLFNDESGIINYQSTTTDPGVYFLRYPYVTAKS